MQSSAKNVTEYLGEAPVDRRSALNQLRELCRSSLNGFEETMMYGMPVYVRNGEVEISFASQKNFIAFYVLKKEVMDSFRDVLKARGVSLGKGCIRYSRPEHINFSVVEMILKATRDSTGAICE